jgi:MraZ protein
MERLRGSAETTVDEKGRFKVPAVFRTQIEETYGNEFFVTSIEGADVLVYPMPVWNGIEEKLAALPAVHRAKQKFLTRVNTFGQAAKMDGQGRLLVPALLRESAGVTGEALVLGQTDHLLLVEKSKHLSALKAGTFTDEDYDELSRHLV